MHTLNCIPGTRYKLDKKHNGRAWPGLAKSAIYKLTFTDYIVQWQFICDTHLFYQYLNTLSKGKDKNRSRVAMMYFCKCTYNLSYG